MITTETKTITGRRGIQVEQTTTTMTGTITDITVEDFIGAFGNEPRVFAHIDGDTLLLSKRSIQQVEGEWQFFNGTPVVGMTLNIPVTAGKVGYSIIWTDEVRALLGGAR